MIDRRTLLASSLAMSVAAHAKADVAPERIALWPGAPPGGEGLAVRDEVILRNPKGGDPEDIAWPHIATPAMTVARPSRPNGAAILILPGGGYTRIAVPRRPSPIAQMFSAQGITAFELLYRLPHDGWHGGPDTPLQDAQRAMRLIRAGAATWGVDPVRVAAIGFSAGGHLVGQLGQRFDRTIYKPVDAADRQSARPIAVGMFFPVVSMLPPNAHPQSRRELLGANASDELARAYSLERDVPKTTPPTFVCHAADDKTVPVANSLAMFAGLQAAGIPSELMIAEKGGHGIRLIEPGGKPHVWFDVFKALAARHGWLPVG